MRGTDLTGRFLELIFELGASSNTVDPIWQVMPPSIADGPFTHHRRRRVPLVTTDRPFERGDVVFVDNGINYEGYKSDYGHTWIVGDEADAVKRDQCARYRAVIDAVIDAIEAGATALDLTRVAKEVGGRRAHAAGSRTSTSRTARHRERGAAVRGHRPRRRVR